MIRSDQSCLSEKCDLMCQGVYSELLEFIKKLFDGSVTFNEIETVTKKMQQFTKLCAAIPEHEVKKVTACLDLRKCECDIYKKYRFLLGSFCRELEAAKLQITGQCMVHIAGGIITVGHRPISVQNTLMADQKLP